MFNIRTFLGHKSPQLPPRLKRQLDKINDPFNNRKSINYSQKNSGRLSINNVKSNITDQKINS